ncbi:hypothetical protein Bhyg_16010 [Pseudolycoriella hygida]|uniref:Uncharacterized protein n=1 Tax=Pseudolycoriella hygida TaxID=35572 RepID=A0A9Q0MJR6_9DIPT|nr:hypothetical protein Bhyg_16010 [Pseudolycoriella hygida]
MDHKRSHSPTQPPSWFLNHQRELKEVTLALQQQDLAILESSLLLLENQYHQFYKWNRPSPCAGKKSIKKPRTIKIEPNSTAVHHRNSPNTNVSSCRIIAGHGTQATLKMCWFHKNFGINTTNCVGECAMAPISNAILPTKTLFHFNLHKLKTPCTLDQKEQPRRICATTLLKILRKSKVAVLAVDLGVVWIESKELQTDVFGGHIGHKGP